MLSPLPVPLIFYSWLSFAGKPCFLLIAYWLSCGSATFFESVKVDAAIEIVKPIIAAEVNPPLHLWLSRL